LAIVVIVIGLRIIPLIWSPWGTPFAGVNLELMDVHGNAIKFNWLFFPHISRVSVLNVFMVIIVRIRRRSKITVSCSVLQGGFHTLRFGRIHNFMLKYA
jgi:hypothetical protein